MKYNKTGVLRLALAGNLNFLWIFFTSLPSGKYDNVLNLWEKLLLHIQMTQKFLAMSSTISWHKVNRSLGGHGVKLIFIKWSWNEEYELHVYSVSKKHKTVLYSERLYKCIYNIPKISCDFRFQESFQKIYCTRNETI